MAALYIIAALLLAIATVVLAGVLGAPWWQGALLFAASSTSTFLGYNIGVLGTCMVLEDLAEEQPSEVGGKPFITTMN
jgi:hypothetical protein